jgi:hypothetical protein
VLGGPGWRFAGRGAGRRGLYELRFRRPGGQRLTALWYANERPPRGGGPFARVEPATPERTVLVHVAVGDGASRTVRVGQDPIFVR